MEDEFLNIDTPENVAFGYEMTADYHERTRLHAFANSVGQLAWLGVPGT